MNYKKKSYNFANLDLWLTFLRDDLELKGVAMGFARIPAGKGYTFAHQHEQQESNPRPRKEGVGRMIVAACQATGDGMN